MELKQSLEIMEKWQHWRRCKSERCHCEAVNATELGQANDVAIKFIKEGLEKQKKQKK